MIVTAWNNGSHHTSGAGYGLKIKIKDRDMNFDSTWQSIVLDLPDKDCPIKININKSSFWNNTCHELISIEIGKWLLKHKYAPWLKGKPPKFNLIPMQDNHFRLETL